MFIKLGHTYGFVFACVSVYMHALACLRVNVCLWLCKCAFVRIRWGQCKPSLLENIVNVKWVVHYIPIHLDRQCMYNTHFHMVAKRIGICWTTRLMHEIWKDPRGVEKGTDWRNMKNIRKIHRHYFVENTGKELAWQKKSSSEWGNRWRIARV